MPRQMRFIVLISILVLATLACNAVTRPFNQAQETIATVESLATAMPVETLMALPSMLPSEMPSFDLTSMPGGDGTSMPYTADCFDPKSDPLEEWKGIPIMPDAKLGEECGDIYVFTFEGKLEDAKAYYDETLSALDWQSFAGMSPTDVNGLFLIYQKEGETLSIVVTASTQGEGIWLVMLTKG